jgi:single-strand DNA-binding protein
LATSETYTPKDGGEKVTTTEWHNLVAWRNTAELIEKWVKKGSRLYVEGKLKTESYDKDGVKHYVTKVVVDQVQFLDSKAKEGANLPPSEMADTNRNEPEGNDLPFA